MCVARLAMSLPGVSGFSVVCSLALHKITTPVMPFPSCPQVFHSFTFVPECHISTVTGTRTSTK